MRSLQGCVGTARGRILVFATELLPGRVALGNIHRGLLGTIVFVRQNQFVVAAMGQGVHLLESVRAKRPLTQLASVTSLTLVVSVRCFGSLPRGRGTLLFE